MNVPNIDLAMQHTNRAQQLDSFSIAADYFGTASLGSSQLIACGVACVICLVCNHPASGFSIEKKTIHIFQGSVLSVVHSGQCSKVIRKGA